MFEKFKKKHKIRRELTRMKLCSFTKGTWTEPNKFLCYLYLTDELKELLNTKANVMECEYWKNKKTCHYRVFVDTDCNDYKKDIDTSVFKTLDSLLIEFVEFSSLL